jgi:RNA polymerase sigma factor (TIGR02999 family)
VNEAWLKLAKNPGVSWTSHVHFKRIAACAMRQIIIGAARRRSAGKRGLAVTFDEELQAGITCEEELLALDAALDELARMSPRQAAVVESRFFGGLEVSEIAALLDLSEATVLRDWRAARAWLAPKVRESTAEHPIGS